MGTFLGTGGEHREAEPGLGGAARSEPPLSLSAKVHVPGEPGREMTCDGSSPSMSRYCVGRAGGSESITIGPLVALSRPPCFR